MAITVPGTTQKIGVLFVCAGNICRSPLAEGLFLHLAQEQKVVDRFHVDSAGTGDWHAGDRPDPRSIAVARKHRISLPSFARQVQKSDFTTFHLILCMDEDNLNNLYRVAPPECHDRIHLIRKYDRTAPTDGEVPDPYHGGEAHFEEVYTMLEKACIGLLNSLR
jgi:protein-tyrosine phosphatase